MPTIKLNTGEKKQKYFKIHVPNEKQSQMNAFCYAIFVIPKPVGKKVSLCNIGNSNSKYT
jgi:hypothetical protein